MQDKIAMLNDNGATDDNINNSQVAVIGGGIIGICVALGLQKSGQQVILIAYCFGTSSSNCFARYIQTNSINVI